MKKSMLPIVVFVSWSAAAASAQEIRLAGTPLPMLSLAKRLPGLGYGVITDLVHEAAKEGEVPLTFVWLPFKRAQSVFVEGGIPFIYGAPFLFASHKIDPKELGFIPVYRVRSVFVYYEPKQKTPITYDKLEDLKNRTVIALRGSPTQDLEKAGMIVTNYDYLQSALKMLILGRGDMICENELTLTYTIRNEFKDDAQHFKIIPKPAYSALSGLVYRVANKDSVTAANKFKIGLDKIKANGTYKKILEKYWGTGSVPAELLAF